MSDIDYKTNNDILSSHNNVQYYCFQSGEIRESGAASVITITGVKGSPDKKYKVTQDYRKGTASAILNSLNDHVIASYP